MKTRLHKITEQIRTERRPGSIYRATLLFLFGCAAGLFFAGCHQESHTDDPQMKPIEATLKTDLPVGSTVARVTTYLESRGFETEAGSKPGTLVAIIRHIDTERVVPVTARVTFFFDANGNLNTFEMQRMFNKPIPK